MKIFKGNLIICLKGYIDTDKCRYIPVFWLIGTQKTRIFDEKGNDFFPK